MPDAPYLITRLRLWDNRLQLQLRSPGRFALTLLVLTAIWGSLYVMFRIGLFYILLMPWFDFLFLPAVFSVFLLVVFLLMIVSSLVLHAGGMYQGSEAELLLCLPISPARAALYRSTELCLLNCLGALYLTTPLILAASDLARPGGTEPFTTMTGAWTLWFLLPPFVLLPSLLGGMGAIAARRIGQALSPAVIVLGAAVVALGLGASLFAGFDTAVFGDRLPAGRLLRLANEALGGARAWYWPSQWVVQGLFAPAFNEPARTIWYGATLLSATGLCLLAWVGTIRGWYYQTWLLSNVTDSSSAQGSSRPNRIRQLSLWPVHSLAEQFGTLLLKDAIVFVRNRTVRTQAVLLVGPLLLYFGALRSLYGSLGHDPWQTLLIGGTNVAALAVILCAVGCRFIMPMVGIEGRKFWLLRMAPPKLSTLLVEKWIFGVLVLLLIGQPLLFLANRMAFMDGLFTGVSHLGLLLLAGSISAICIGTGALFPDFTHETDAAHVNGATASIALLLSLGASTALLGGVAFAYSRFLYSGELALDAQFAWLTDPAFLGLLRRNFVVGAGGGGIVGLVLLVIGHARLRRVEVF